jgi:hypothetical protein
LAKKVGLVRWLETQPPLGMGRRICTDAVRAQVDHHRHVCLLAQHPDPGGVILVAGILAAIHVI